MINIKKSFRNYITVFLSNSNNVFTITRFKVIISNANFRVQLKIRGCPRGVMVKAMDCGIVVSEFEFKLRYYDHFRANTLGKGMNPLILQALG